MPKRSKPKKTPILIHLEPDQIFMLDLLKEKGIIASRAHGIRNAVDEYLNPAKDAILARATAPAREAARTAEIRAGLSARKGMAR